MKINATNAIWEAATRLFIPSQTLNIPKVRVSTVKNSTVPKSEITSMHTKAKPAMIAGLAIGRPTWKKEFLLYIEISANVDEPLLEIIKSEIKIFW